MRTATGVRCVVPCFVTRLPANVRQKNCKGAFLAVERAQHKRPERDDEAPPGTELERVALPEAPIGSSTEARLTEREQYIRFALANLGARNAHHDFEELCRQFAQARIASNILPATGPVAAGGDQGRDAETFHTVLKDELGPYGGFLGRVSDGLYVFTCTIQQGDVDKKILADVKKILENGRKPAAIYAFCTGNLPVGKRKKLEKYLAKQYEGILQIIDREALAVQLAQRDIYWIAERYLDLPAALAPAPVEDDAAQLPNWYLEDRKRWRERGVPQGMLADILDLKDGLRHATRFAAARPDLPFWLGLSRQLTGDEVAYEVRQRARYEVAWATVQALPELRSADDLIRAFFADLLDVADVDPARYDDASTVIMFATTSLYGRQTDITPVELRGWNDELRARLRAELEGEERPTRRALLLEILGGLALHRDPLQHPIAVEPLPHVDVLDMSDETGAMPKVLVERDVWPAVIDVDETMRAWGDLAAHLEDTPLFPVDRFAKRVGVMAPLLLDQPGYRDFIDAVDADVARTSGAAAVAERARDRGLYLRLAGRTLDALHELHTAKVEWWKGDTLRGSLLSMLLIAGCYRDLGMFQAARYNALGVAYAAHGGGDEVVDLVADGYMLASECDYAAGAWCSAMELVDLGLTAQRVLVDLDVNERAADLYRRGVATIGFTLRIARQLTPKFVPFVQQIAKSHGLLNDLNEIDNSLPPEGHDALLERIDDQLYGRPLNDAGSTRVIRFAALGTDWTITSSNRFEDARAAERLAAAAQITLVELAQNDLCFIPTKIRVRVEAREPGGDPRDVVRTKPSNDGRDWLVRLLRYDGDALDPEPTQVELLSVISEILMDASLLPASDYLAMIEDAFRRGLTHKLGAVRPYDELGVPRSVYDRTPRAIVFPPFDPEVFQVTPSKELEWREDDGPTYDRSTALDLVRSRYERIPAMIPKTLERLAHDSGFLTIVAELRSRGWLDWHILQALINYAMNKRLAAEGLDRSGSHEQRMSRMRELMDTGDEIDETPSDLLQPTLRDLEFQGEIQLAVILAGWELHINQSTPDLPALRTFLERRYHYLEDDVEHTAFFEAASPSSRAATTRP
jgi:hypothetical protein